MAAKTSKTKKSRSAITAEGDEPMSRNMKNARQGKTGLNAEFRVAVSVGVFESQERVLDFIRSRNIEKIIDGLECPKEVQEAPVKFRRLVVDIGRFMSKVAFNLENGSEEMVNSFKELKENIKSACVCIMGKLGVLYKVFSFREPGIVLGALQMLSVMFQLNEPEVENQFLDKFDFNNKHFAQLFVPSRDNFDLKVISDASIRYAVVDFWLLMIRRLEPALKKAMLTNSHIMGSFWQYLEMERYEHITEILGFLEEEVLKEAEFKRSIKCQIIGAPALAGLRSLFNVAESPLRLNDSDEAELQDFKTKFYAFMNTLITSRDLGLLFPINEFGAVHTVNGKEFKVNNKLLLMLLTSLKPWESNTQLGFAMTILNAASELVAPYMATLVSHSGGYHEPMLNSYWIGRSLLYLEILRSPRIPFSYENVALAPLSRQAMTSCLEFPNDLIKQITLELLLAQLKKIRASRNASALATASIISNLPAHSALVPFLTHETRVIKLTATSVIALTEKVAPKSSPNSVISLVGQKISAIDLNSCTSYDLVLLDKYLAIQSNNELKWWNKSGAHSFFTALLLLSENSFLKGKVLKILDSLLRSSLSFSPRLVESPVLGLINALLKSRSDGVPNLIDETISRCQKSPYKYLDQSNANFGKISIFLVVLLEQVQYLRKNSLWVDSMQVFLQDFIRYMVLIGESQAGVERLLAANGVEMSVKFSDLKLKKNLTSNMDFAETVMILNELHKPKSDVLFDGFTRLGDYCMSLDMSNVAIQWLVDPVTFRFLDFSVKLSDSQALAISLYNELLKQLNEKFEHRLDFSSLASFLLEAVSVKQKPKNQNVLKSMLWMFSHEQLQKAASFSKNELVFVQVYEMFLERNIPFTPDLDKLLQIDSPRVRDLVSGLKLATLEDVSKVYSKPDFRFVFCQRGKNTEIFEEFLLTVAIDDSLLYQLAPIYPKLAAKHSEDILRLAKSMENWQQSLEIFIAYPGYFSTSEELGRVFAHKDSHQKSSMTALFASFINSFYDDASQEVHVWFHRAMLYVTRKFAECSTLSPNFYEFLAAVDAVVAKHPSLLQSVPSDIVQAQAEVVLAHAKWVRSRECLAHVSQVLQPKLNSDKLLQMFITNSKMILGEIPNISDSDLRADSAKLLHQLFKRVKPTEGLLKQVVLLYNGTMTSEDLVLKSILVEMEAKLMVSWIVHVTDWDFHNEIRDDELELVGRVKLLTASKKSFTVTLNKKAIMNTVDKSASYAGDAYDPEFLLQLILNNQELVSEVDGQLEFELDAIIGSHILRFIVASLANPATRDHCIVFMHGILRFLERITKPLEKKEDPENKKESQADNEETLEPFGKKKKKRVWRQPMEEKQVNHERKSVGFKHKNLLKIYIASILHTVKVADHVVPVVWYMVASFSVILVEPTHFMYDRVKSFILSTPVIRSYEVPLFKRVMLFLRTDNNLAEDDYYRQVTWLVDELSYGVQNNLDVDLLGRRAVMEWMFNMTNLSCLSNEMRHKVLFLAYRIQQLSEGGDMLATRFGALTSLEAMKRGAAADSGFSHVGLNVDQVALRFGLLSESSKRLREWSCNDVIPSVKRIHASGEKVNR